MDCFGCEWRCKFDKPYCHDNVSVDEVMKAVKKIYPDNVSMKILEITRSFYPSVGGLEKFVLQRMKIYKELHVDYHILTSTYSSEKIDNNLNFNNVTILKQFTKYNFVFGLKKKFFNSYDFICINQIGNFLFQIEAF